MAHALQTGEQTKFLALGKPHPRQDFLQVPVRVCAAVVAVVPVCVLCKHYFSLSLSFCVLLSEAAPDRGNSGDRPKRTSASPRVRSRVALRAATDAAFDVLRSRHRQPAYERDRNQVCVHGSLIY
jgi:hypothetical protein